MQRLNGYVIKAHTAWLASSVNCCLPIRLQEQQEDEKEKAQEKELEKEQATQSATTSRRNSPLPLSKYNTSTTVNTQPQPQEAPKVPAGHIIEEHPRFSRESRRMTKTASTGWYGEDPELRALRAASRHSRQSTSHAAEIRRSLSRRQSLSRRKSKGKAPEEPKPVCISPIPEIPPFRPLHLSIHLPGNELPKLPKFSDDPEEVDEIPPVPEIPRPAQALMLSKPEPVLTRSLSRKTVATTQSTEGGRRSTDTDMTMVEVSWRPRTSSLSYSRMRSNSATSARSNQDFLEMLNNPLPALPKQFVLKPKSSESLRKKKSNSDMKGAKVDKTEPAIEKPVLVRSASDQNKRLQNHLQEREQIDVTSPACSTIAEEKSPLSSPRSNSKTSPQRPRRSSSCPPRQIETPSTNPDVSSALGLGLQLPTQPAPALVVPSAGILTTSEVIMHDEPAPPKPLKVHKPIVVAAAAAPVIASATITDFTTVDPVAMPEEIAASFNAARQRSSSGSSTLLNTVNGTPEIISSRPPTAADDLNKPLITTTVVALNSATPQNATSGAVATGKADFNTVISTRLTQWLSRSKSLSKDSLRPVAAPATTTIAPVGSGKADIHAATAAAVTMMNAVGDTEEKKRSSQSWFDNRDSALFAPHPAPLLTNNTSAPITLSTPAAQLRPRQAKDDEQALERERQKIEFRVSRLAKEIGLGELLDQKLGIVHTRTHSRNSLSSASDASSEEDGADIVIGMHPADTKTAAYLSRSFDEAHAQGLSAGGLGLNLEGKVEKACGITRSRSATESTFVGTEEREKGASIDLVRKIGVAPPVEVGMAM